VNLSAEEIIVEQFRKKEGDRKMQQPTEKMLPLVVLQGTRLVYREHAFSPFSKDEEASAISILGEAQVGKTWIASIIAKKRYLTSFTSLYGLISLSRAFNYRIGANPAMSGIHLYRTRVCDHTCYLAKGTVVVKRLCHQDLC